ncbi:uncharacterized protein [Panulirus ornatus]|uniref:uncharacterized protein n=1 Tax=Panulirus ornatus TaxID=150431 RepID=UPI003A8BDDDC
MSRAGVVRMSAPAAAAVVVMAAAASLLPLTFARQALKGDPGDLGDLGYDLSQYTPSAQVKSRAKRYYLTFPPSSTLTFNNRIKIPLFTKFDSNIQGVFKGFIRAVYTLPSDIVSVGRSQVDQDRVQAYNSLESIFTNFGIDGRQCLLKAICETAEKPTDDYGLVGELLSLVLSPNHSVRAAREELRDYCAAETYGRDVGNCGLAYSSCPFNLDELLRTGLSLLEGSVTGFPAL